MRTPQADHRRLVELVGRLDREKAQLGSEVGEAAGRRALVPRVLIKAGSNALEERRLEGANALEQRRRWACLVHPWRSPHVAVALLPHLDIVPYMPRLSVPLRPTRCTHNTRGNPPPSRLQVSAARQHAASLHRRQTAVEAEATGRLQAQLKVGRVSRLGASS